MIETDWKTGGTILFGLLLITAFAKLRKAGSREPHLPPGPPTIPFLGNLTVLPTKESYLKFSEWAKIYGDIYSLKIGSQTIVVVSSIEAVDNIFEKNMGITDDRPTFTPGKRMLGLGGGIGFSHYGPLWKKWRRAANEMTKPTARAKHYPISIAEKNHLMLDVLEKPDDIFHHIKRYTFSTISSNVMGIRAPRTDSSLMPVFYSVIGDFAEMLEPGNTPPVDLLPTLNYIPDRFVCYWKSRCDSIKERMEGMFFGMADYARERIDKGQGNGCHAELMLDKAQEWGLGREDVGWVIGALLIAGVDSSKAFLHFAIILATVFSPAQHKIQLELDSVVGSGRAPTPEDIPNLPYLNSFIKEVFRFRPVVPTGVPHATTQEVHYSDHLGRSFVIPKQSTLFINIWGIYHDPNMYDDPESFDPDRFVRHPYGVKKGYEDTLGNPECLKKLDSLAFGMGRRKCVGMNIALSNISLVMANLLWGFQFSPLLDKEGREVLPDPWAFDATIVNEPHPFKVTIKPRSFNHSKIIKENYRDAKPVLSQFEQV